MAKVSLYKKIYNELLQKIDGGELGPGDKLPTELELTQAYGVSRVTVVTALNELAKQRYIIRYPKKGSFVSDKRTDDNTKENALPVPWRNLTGGGEIKNVIGFIMPSIADIFAVNIIQGIYGRIGGDPNFSCMISSSRGQEYEEHIISDMLKRNLSGIILFPTDQEIYNERILEMKLNKYPLVLIDRYLPGINTHHVISDNVLSGRLAAEHLYDWGHKKICVCCGGSKETFSVDERIQGVQQVARERGFVFGCTSIITGMAEFLQDGDGMKEGIAEKLLASENTAFVATDSSTAVILYRFFRENGLRIPADKSILSYDAPLFNAAPDIPFTYVDQSEFNMGYEAADIMVSLLNRRLPAEEYIKKVVPPKIVVGRTTGGFAEN